MTRTTELPKGERHAFQKLWMDRKGKGRNNWSFAKTQPKWLCFEELCFQFIFNLATFLTSPSISGWSMSVWQEAETDFFYRVYVFFSWRRTDFVVLVNTGKYSRDPSKGHQTTHEDFSLETSDRFHPLNFYFLFPISFFSFTRTSCGLNIAGNAPFTTFVILYKVFTMSLVSKCWEDMCRSR